VRDLVIAGSKIGGSNPPFLIAEVGINHNGSREIAFAMIRAAKEAGADAVKFQTFKAEEFCSDPAQMFTYKSQGKEITESMLEMFRRYEFSRVDWIAIREECDRADIVFMSTPQNRSDLQLLLELGIPAIKIGSDDFTNLPLLKSYAETKLPIVLSCGMADLGEVDRSLNAVGALDGYPTVLLLCTSQYPTPPQDVNLRKMQTLRGAYPDLVLGFSDHSQGVLASSLALALGATVFEKHFTLDRNLSGPDHWFSENPETLGEWTGSVRRAYTMMGSPIVRPTIAEREMRVLARRSVVALRDMKIGDICDEQNVGLCRPGNGLGPEMLDFILGGKITRDVRSGEMLKFGDVTK
jgi:N,N'-diacetyllegionaminate synthase